MVRPLDRLAGLSGAAAARGYSWGGRVAQTLQTHGAVLPVWPGWGSARVRAIARRLVNGLTDNATDGDELARICESEAARRYEKLRNRP